ncbi:metallophosphoesterase family protein [Hyphomonas johnsonii]|nr:metallophosphoesterase family protein [Hyphomonas johnsonii]
MTETTYCAIGDIHGELDRLKALHDSVRRHADGVTGGAPVTFVHLGDLIDRGQDSCGVVDYLMELECDPVQRSITIRGNHEQLMIQTVRDKDESSRDRWLEWGGRATLDSYHRRGLDGPPDHHLDWLAALPTIYRDEARDLVFVHAGVDPDRFPDCGERTQMWTRRREFFDPRCWTAPGLVGQTIVHGHSPTEDDKPEVAGAGQRINIDTGAVYGGRLTAAFLVPGEQPVFLHT